MAKDNDNPKGVTIIVNTEEKPVPEDEISYDQLVTLAFGSPPKGDDDVYNISVRDSVDAVAHTTLRKGQSIKVKEGMVFNVVRTDRS